MNFAALVEYDGTRFAGFQRQPPEKGPTVQGAIEAAIARIAGATIPIEAAGRTDSGVHATGQVINFTAPDRLSEADWHRALNALLPADVAIRAMCQVDDAFRARWRALARSYRYRLFAKAVRAPLRERYAWRTPKALDVGAMCAAAALLVGEHDFGAFGSSPRDQRATGIRGHTVRTMLAATCRQSELAPDEVECDFTANAFLSGMVRRLVGTIARVGDGRLSLADFQHVLESRDKALAAPAAPACGLYLVGVTYPAGMVSW
ncbi:MAG: tRNA pseudouridine(38-40) synthase [Ktedonobacterales bacterium]|nr:MAG: tRNA pseudouridine(38-40) synthase [Ktedonobacterales bacterium]